MKIGAPGEKVEVRLAKFGNIRNHKESHWVRGVCERGSSKVFLVLVESHTNAAVIKKILEFVVTDSTIITDRCDGCANLHRHSYNHIAVGHHLTCVPTCKTFTWNGRTSRNLPKAGGFTSCLEGYLALFMIRKSFLDTAQLFHHFFAHHYLHLPSSHLTSN